MKNAWNIVLLTLTSVGGVGAVVACLSAWLGKVMANRIAECERASHARELEAERARYSEQLELLKSELDVQREKEKRAYTSRFELHNQVWGGLTAVKLHGDDLWNRVTRDNLERFLKALENVRIAVELGRLILMDDHYRRLQTILSGFDEYYLGKCRLADLRSQEKVDWVFSEIPEASLTQEVRANSQTKKDYESLLDDIALKFKSQMGTLA